MRTVIIIIFVLLASGCSVWGQNLKETETPGPTTQMPVTEIQQQEMSGSEIIVPQQEMSGSVTGAQIPMEAQPMQPIGVQTVPMDAQMVPADAQAVEPVVDPRPVVNVPDPHENQSTYTLGKEDIIRIDVMRHPEVSGTFVINNEGKIQYGFVGDIMIEGFTKDQVREHITKLLSTYIVTPEVTVIIAGYNSKVIYVIGEVGSPGKIFMRGDTITVREALMQSGLPLLTAANKKSKVITPADSGNALQRDVNVDALLYEGDLRENLVMKPGDTLYVPPTFLAKTMRVINPIAQPIGTAAGTGRSVVAPF